MVREVQKKLSVSERSACRATSQPRSTQRYKAQQRNGERKLIERMRELALRFPRFGYRRVCDQLRKEGFKVNVKRVHRLWRREGLKVPQKQHKRARLRDGSSENGITRRRPERMNQVWSFDFCFDRTSDNRPLKIFNVIDEFTRRCLAIEVGRHMTGPEVVKILKKLIEMHGEPEHLRCDNGPEFACDAVRRWVSESKLSTLYIAPGSPWENGYIESYHARLRDELLDREEFGTLEQAKALLSIWREEYNSERPHSALGYMTPEAFAETCRGAGPGFAALSPGQHREEEKTGVSVAQ